MTTLTINIPDKERKLITEMIKKLGGNVIKVEEDKESAKERAILKLENGLSEINDIKEGKSKGLSLEELF